MLILGVCLQARLIVFSQTLPNFFHHLTPEQCLSQAINSFVYKDSRGFVWVTSIDGLNQFDGRTVKVYRPNPDAPNAMRLENKLAWDIQVADNVDTFETEIPSMILQPYVENAVWHGIAHKPEGGKITISIGRDTSEALLLVVEDNGVGRAHGRELRQRSDGTTQSRATTKPHESKGLKITEERLALYDQKHGTKSSVTTVDLFDNEGKAAGTRVEVRIA